MSSITQSSDPLSELRALSAQIGTKPVETMLLRIDKHGHLSFEEKSFFGKIKRFFTVTLFRSNEYNFESNIQKIGKLFEFAIPEVEKDDELKSLESKINELIAYVVTKKQNGSFKNKTVTRLEPSVMNQKIAELQRMAHTAHQPLDIEDLKPLEAFRAKYDTLSFSAKRCGVLKLAEQMQGFVYDSPVSKEAYSENISWLAEKCASFCELETSFALYRKAIDETGLVGEDHSILNQFTEIGLLLKRFTAIEHVLDKLPTPKKPSKAQNEIRERIERVQSFGKGGITTNGFKEGEWKMLTLFALAYEILPGDQKSGYQRLAKNAVEIRDFLIYTTGNTEFNKRLKVQLENDTITDENVLSAIDYFATFSFKSDLGKWKSNQVYCEHISKVQQLHDVREELIQKRELLSKLESGFQTDDLKFIAKTGDRGLRAIPDTMVVEIENIPGKTTKLGQRKARQKVTKKVIPGVKAMTASEWKKIQVAQAGLDRNVMIQKLKGEIPLLENKIAQFQTELSELSKQFPKIVGKKPEKLQMLELPILDSTYRFHEQLTEEMRKVFDLDKNPLFKAEAFSLEALKGSYEWIQERCLGGSGYHTGDLSFVNELKKEAVTGKAPTDFTDRAAVALFPFGHMAIIDEEHGAIAFSHQRLAFDHSPVSLAEYLYYDTYRLDFSKLALPRAFAAIELDLKKNEKVLEEEMQARNMTKEEYLLHELEERFEQKIADELEQKRKSGCDTDEKKWEGIERPDFAEIKTLAQLKAWQSNVNAGKEKNMQLELYELFEIPDDCEPEVESKIQELRVDYLRDLYKDISNDEQTQTRAFLNSWLFAGPLNVVSRITDKTINPQKVQIKGEMCCSQFAQLITLSALQNLDAEFREMLGGSQEKPCLNIPKLTQKRYEAGTTEFVLKEFRQILRPIQAPSVMKDIVTLPRRNFLQPIPIDSTVTYMAKRLIKAA